MTTDLFSVQEQFQQLPMPGAEIYFLRSLELPAPDNELLRKLIDTSPWRSRKRLMWGKLVDQPRLNS